MSSDVSGRPAGERDSVVAVERAMVAIRRSQTRRTLGRIAGPDGMDPTLFGVLDAVEEHGGPCAVTDIAAALGVDQPRASRLAARTEEEGLVTRRPDASDRRRTLLELTATGRDRLDRAHRARQEVFAAAMAGWPDADRAEFARLITAFVASFRETVAARADGGAAGQGPEAGDRGDGPVSATADSAV
ncbi:MarR family transcriptional regulator [Actinomadura logoneensis]|uniref:MarR family transcriptional regulator n=1 Tax=Actinomadura logoneensis TaxID=2293572 RepID=A0A372JRA3_9ACTN|nr:MarR family transcriptional regulator [Actinomadura logoneensis]RFU42563.1 MarR family transcriptional regulator [Actinomadura logoneensis]